MRGSHRFQSHADWRVGKTSLSTEAKAQITSIPWQQIYGMRNRIIHGYAGIHMQIVWDTVAEGIPKLNAELDKTLENVDS